MEATKIEALEAYFKTNNEHYNSYTFQILVDSMSTELFDDPEVPLMFFSNAVELATLQHDTPVKVAAIVQSEIDRLELNDEQSLFVHEWILKYLRGSEFDNADPEGIKRLLIAQIEKLRQKISDRPENVQPLTGNIRHTLKKFVESELEQIPETMKGLDPVQRLNILCKLMPYAMPKTESVESNFGETKKKILAW